MVAALTADERIDAPPTPDPYVNALSLKKFENVCHISGQHAENIPLCWPVTGDG